MNTVEAPAEAPPDQATVDALRLFEQHGTAIYRFCQFTLRRQDQAEDAVQETFVKLLLHLRGGGDARNLRAWLYTVAANACHDRLRARRRWLPWQADLDDRIAPSGDDGPDLRIAHEALSALAPRDRLLLSLRVHGLSYREIATAAGIRETSVGRLLARALGRWKQAVERHKPIR